MRPLRSERRPGAIRLTALALVIGAGVAMLLTLPMTDSERVDRGELRVGITPWPGYEFIPLAERLGYFRDAGVRVRTVEFASLGDARRAFERGQVDLVCVTVHELIESRRQGARDPRILRLIDASSGGDVIVGSTRVDEVRKLAGRRVAVETGSINEYVLRRGAEIADVDVDTIEIVPMSQLHMADALRRGEVDAVVTYPPLSNSLSVDEGFPILFTTAEIPGEVLDLLVVDRPFAEANRNGIAAMLNALDRAIAHYRARPDDAIALIASRTGESPSRIAAIFRDEIEIYDRRRDLESRRSGDARQAVRRHLQAMGLDPALADTCFLVPTIEPSATDAALPESLP
ncbi:MAG TPA: ABC transporter substrate-binding protein [Pirellulaceae bacterium]|nr:ABC transporter substrate-binding protein [Pirellulaceae bacterium]